MVPRRQSTAVTEEVSRPERDWIGEIAAAWSASVASLFRTGDLLMEAKAALPYGEFGNLIKNRLPFGVRTAQRLLEIAGDARLREPSVRRILPPSIPTLLKLSKLSNVEFARASKFTSEDELTAFLDARPKAPKSVRETHLADSKAVRDAHSFVDVAATIVPTDVIGLLRGDRSAERPAVEERLREILGGLKGALH